MLLQFWMPRPQFSKETVLRWEWREKEHAVYCWICRGRLQQTQVRNLEINRLCNGSNLSIQFKTFFGVEIVSNFFKKFLWLGWVLCRTICRWEGKCPRQMVPSSSYHYWNCFDVNEVVLSTTIEQHVRKYCVDQVLLKQTDCRFFVDEFPRICGKVRLCSTRRSSELKTFSFNPPWW